MDIFCCGCASSREVLFALAFVVIILVVSVHDKSGREEGVVLLDELSKALNKFLNTTLINANYHGCIFYYISTNTSFT